MRYQREANVKVFFSIKIDMVLYTPVKVLHDFSQWRTQGGGQGAMAPPKPESQGAKLSFGPPHSRYMRFFFFEYT